MSAEPVNDPSSDAADESPRAVAEGIPSLGGDGPDDEAHLDRPGGGTGGVPRREREPGVSPRPSGPDSASQPDHRRMDIRGRKSVQGRQGGAAQGDEVAQPSAAEPEQLPLFPLSRTVAAFQYSGPIPDPAMLARYNEVDASFADRIMRMAEAEVFARTESMEAISRSEARAVQWGAVSAVVVVIVGLLSAVGLTLTGDDGAALLLAVPALLYGVARVVEALRGRSSDVQDEGQPSQQPN